MKSQTITLPKRPLIKTLFLAVAAQTLAAGYCQAGPTGGVVVGGTGTIENTGSTTRINQETHRLALEWDTFNIAVDERVEFVQPSNNATALNRILDNNGSRILGQIDANGRVILMNPNGVFFGESATVNVGSLVASGLNINSADFMNGDLILTAIEGTSGAVVNSGVINAATGGNVALVGKTVANQGLISANLGHVALASGSQAVVTFDEQGLIGVRIDQETLASEVDDSYAVKNSGTLEAKGGKILLNASVSADLFSQAVNSGDMGGSAQAVMHDDGSFTLGRGMGVVNTGTLNVSTDADSIYNAGQVVLAGVTVEQDGAILANAQTGNQAGHVLVQASENINLGPSSTIAASATESTSGLIRLQAESIQSGTGAAVLTSGASLLKAEVRITAPEIETNNLSIHSTGQVDQAGSINASGETHLLLANGANVDLTNTNNDFTTLSMDARYNTHAQINDRNDIALADINLVGSSLHVHSLDQGATLSQTADSRVQLVGSDLHLEAANLVLGEQGSTTAVNHSSLNLRFADHINTNRSITLVDDFALMPTQATIFGGSFGGVSVTGSETIDLHADFNEQGTHLTIANLQGGDATLSGPFETTQSGPIKISGALTWNSGTAVLAHPENDVAVLQGSGMPFGDLIYVDSNDLTLGTINPEFIYRELHPSVNITSLGKGATIRQAPNTELSGYVASLSADNIHLGANGQSELNLAGGLDLNFNRAVHINGTYDLGGLSIYGNNRSNTVKFGPHASGSLYSRLHISLPGGNNKVLFINDFHIMGGGLESTVAVDIEMGSGNDRLTFLGDFLVGSGFGTTEANLNINMGNGNDQMTVLGDFAVSAMSTNTDFDMGAGNDRVLLLNGLTVNAQTQGASHFSLGSGNDQLIFGGNMDIPVTLGAGRDLVIVMGSDIHFDLTDYDPEKDRLIVANP